MTPLTGKIVVSVSRHFREKIAWSRGKRLSEPRRLGELLIEDPVIAEPNRLALDDERVARIERAGACLAVVGQRDLARGTIARALHRHEAILRW